MQQALNSYRIPRYFGDGYKDTLLSEDNDAPGNSATTPTLAHVRESIADAYQGQHDGLSLSPIDHPGICFKFNPDMLTSTYDVYSTAVKDRPAPHWLKEIQRSAHRIAEIQAPRIETDAYHHFDFSVVQVLDELLAVRKPYPPVDGDQSTEDYGLGTLNSSTNKTVRGLRRYAAVHNSLYAGNPDYVARIYDPKSRKTKSSFHVELKRPQVLTDARFTEMFTETNELWLRVTEKTYGLYHKDGTAVSGKHHLADILAQWFLEFDLQRSFIGVLSSFNYYMLGHRKSATCIEFSKLVPNHSEDMRGPGGHTLEMSSMTDTTEDRFNAIEFLVGLLLQADNLEGYINNRLPPREQMLKSSKKARKKARIATPESVIPGGSQNTLSGAIPDEPTIPPVPGLQGSPSSIHSPMVTSPIDAAFVLTANIYDQPLIQDVMQQLQNHTWLPDSSDDLSFSPDKLKPPPQDSISAQLATKFMGRGRSGHVFRITSNKDLRDHIDCSISEPNKPVLKIVDKDLVQSRNTWHQHTNSGSSFDDGCSDCSYNRYSFAEAVDAIRNEAFIYDEFLLPLQGVIVPDFLGLYVCRSTTDSSDEDLRSIYVLVIGDAGPEFVGSRDAIREVYRQLHSVDVIHHDVRARHIRMGSGDNELPMLIDFEGAEYVGNNPDAEYLKEAEMDEVEQMMARNMDRFMDP